MTGVSSADVTKEAKASGAGTVCHCQCYWWSAQALE